MIHYIRGFVAAAALTAGAVLFAPAGEAQAQTAYSLSQLEPDVRAAVEEARAAQRSAITAAARARAVAARAQSAAQRAQRGVRGTATQTLDGIYGNRRVEGEHNGSQFHGLAVDTTIDGVAIGDVYSGQWADGQSDGPGIYYYARNENNATDSLRYEGDNGSGNAHGHGIYLWLDGDRYEGAFRDNLKAGAGVLTWSDGRRYEGQWARDDQNGYGVLWDARGRVVSAGRWRDGQFVGEGAAPGPVADASAGPLPGGFVLSAAEEVLAGDVEVLIEAFIWGESQQGHDYWSALHASGRMTPQATAILRDWVARYQSGERPGATAPTAPTTVDANALPPSLDIETVRAVLAGNVELLIEAFVWGDTPQGHDYWSDLHASERMTPQATAILRDWVARYDRGERPASSGGGDGGSAHGAGAMPTGFLPDVAQQALDGDTNQLISAFVWGDSQQGHDYWSDIHSAGGRIPPDAAAHLREWIDRYNAGERPPQLN